MKKTIQTRRRASRSLKFKKLYAKTGKQRKMKAATAAMDAHAELESDVPNVGVGRALLVMLVLHVVAIGAFYVHNKFFGHRDAAPVAQETNISNKSTVSSPAVPTSGNNTPSPANPSAQAVVPVAAVTPSIPSEVIKPFSDRYIVASGDTYQTIARTRNVDEVALRALNNDRGLRSGVVLDLPAQLSSRPVEVTDPIVVRRTAPKAVIVDENEAPVAVMVKPAIQHSQLPDTVSSVRDSGKRYTVKSGDTLWRISNTYGVSRPDLLALNGIADANKLSVGVELKIPAK